MILSETWFMEGYIDFELQKYRLLAYLKDVKNDLIFDFIYKTLPYIHYILKIYKLLHKKYDKCF